MSVIVYFMNGAAKEYQHACSCTNRGQVFTVRRWDQEKRGYESIDSFESSRVKFGVVQDHFGNIDEIIVGGTHA